MRALCSPVVICTLDGDVFLQKQNRWSIINTVECLTNATEYFGVHLLNIICLLPRQCS